MKRTFLLPDGSGEILVTVFSHLNGKPSSAHIQPFRSENGSRKPIIGDDSLVDMIGWAITGINQSPHIRVSYQQLRNTGVEGNEAFVLVEFSPTGELTSKEEVAKLFVRELCAILMCHPDYPTIKRR